MSTPRELDTGSIRYAIIDATGASRDRLRRILAEAEGRELFGANPMTLLDLDRYNTPDPVGAHVPTYDELVAALSIATSGLARLASTNPPALTNRHGANVAAKVLRQTLAAIAGESQAVQS